MRVLLPPPPHTHILSTLAMAMLMSGAVFPLMLLPPGPCALPTPCPARSGRSGARRRLGSGPRRRRAALCAVAGLLARAGAPGGLSRARGPIKRVVSLGAEAP